MESNKVHQDDLEVGVIYTGSTEPPFEHDAKIKFIGCKNNELEFKAIGSSYYMIVDADGIIRFDKEPIGSEYAFWNVHPDQSE
jgi:hypothetical protein